MVPLALVLSISNASWTFCNHFLAAIGFNAGTISPSLKVLACSRN